MPTQPTRSPIPGSSSNLGPAQGLPLDDNGFSPLFRSFPPSNDASRTFPRLSDLLSGVNTSNIGEHLPETGGRDLNFRVTVRDGQGGVNSDDVQLSVFATGTAFAVTLPNTAASTWTGGANTEHPWACANTDLAPISTANVRILLSTDGGLTFPTVLLASTPNDGSEFDHRSQHQFGAGSRQN